MQRSWFGRTRLVTGLAVGLVMLMLLALGSTALAKEAPGGAGEPGVYAQRTATPQARTTPTPIDEEAGDQGDEVQVDEEEGVLTPTPADDEVGVDQDEDAAADEDDELIGDEDATPAAQDEEAAPQDEAELPADAEATDLEVDEMGEATGAAAGPFVPDYLPPAEQAQFVLLSDAEYALASALRILELDPAFPADLAAFEEVEWTCPVVVAPRTEVADLEAGLAGDEALAGEVDEDVAADEGDEATVGDDEALTGDDDTLLDDEGDETLTGEDDEDMTDAGTERAAEVVDLAESTVIVLGATQQSLGAIEEGLSDAQTLVEREAIGLGETEPEGDATDALTELEEGGRAGDLQTLVRAARQDIGRTIGRTGFFSRFVGADPLEQRAGIMDLRTHHRQIQVALACLGGALTPAREPGADDAELDMTPTAEDEEAEEGEAIVTPPAGRTPTVMTEAEVTPEADEEAEVTPVAEDDEDAGDEAEVETTPTVEDAAAEAEGTPAAETATEVGVADISANPGDFADAEVAVRGVVSENIDERTFALDDAEGQPGEAVVLVPGAMRRQPEVGDRLLVRGMVREFNQDAIEEEFGLTVDDELAADLEGEVVIIPRSIRVAR